MKKGKEEEAKKPRRRVKKVKHHSGHHGGAWKVAYADFVTAMMALFLVLWLVSQADTKLKQAIANYFRSPGVFNTMKGGVLSGASKVSKEPSELTSKDEEQALFSVAQALQQKFDTRPEFSKYKEQVKIQVTEEGLKIEMLDKAERVSFPVGSAELSEEAKQVLAEIARGICSLQNPIVIGGHTDSRNFQAVNGYTNWELSADRANAARRVMQTECVQPQQIKRIIGYADSQPLIPEDPYAPANRRISITVLRTVLPENEQQTKPKAETPATETPKKSENKEKIINKPAEISNEIKPAETIDKKSDEIKEAERKLAKEGAISVGEADKVPLKPKKLN
ncbi:MAG: flagellar motor protein MotB [Pyrinomonadaceae bacterium]